MGEGENAMSRKRTQTLEGLTDSAITWFFVGLMLIAAIAAAFGQVVNSCGVVRGPLHFVAKRR